MAEGVLYMHKMAIHMDEELMLMRLSHCTFRIIAGITDA